MVPITNKLNDIRFNYKSDSPFPKEEIKNLNKFKKLINESDFKVVDWITDSRCYNIPTLKNRKFQDKPIGQKLLDNYELYQTVLNYFASLGDEFNLVPELSEFIHNPVQPSLEGGTDEVNEVDDEEVDDEDVNNDEVDEAESSFKLPDYVSSNDSMKFADNTDITTYNIIPGKMLSYNDVCKLTLAISRTQLSHVIQKDESIIFAEEREKSKLKEEMQKYMKLSDIDAEMKANFKIDIDNMSLKQLQYYSSECKKIYEKLKIIHITKQGIDLFDAGYNFAFPKGIKIPGSKKVVKLNKFGESLKKAVFDRNSPFLIGFENMTEKYNLHISDEFLTVCTILGTIAKNIEIEDAEPEEPKEESENEDSNESSTEESENEDSNESSTETEED